MADSKKGVLIQSVSRAIAILRCFREKSELGLTEISALLGLHKSTTAGLVNTLKAEHFLEQDPKTGRLRLGLELFSLAACMRLDLVDICEPHLVRLVEVTGETVNLAVRSGHQVVYVAKKESSHSMRISTSVGQQLPLYCTAIGKVLMAFSHKDEVETLLAELQMRPYTEHTILDKEKLRRELRTIRKESVAYDFEELEYGLICVAVPVLDRNGEPVGAVSVSGPSMRMDQTTCERIVLQLHQLVGKIEKELSRLMPR